MVAPSAHTGMLAPLFRKGTFLMNGACATGTLALWIW